MQPVISHSNETFTPPRNNSRFCFNFLCALFLRTPMLLSFLMHMYVCIYVCNTYKYSNHLDVLGMVIVKNAYCLCCTYLEHRPKAQHGLQINNFSRKYVRFTLFVLVRITFLKKTKKKTYNLYHIFKEISINRKIMEVEELKDFSFY